MTRNLFLYGALRHIPLLELVLGRQLDPADLIETRLADHAIFEASDGTSQCLLSRRGETVEGLLVRGLTPEDIARLSFYRGGFEDDLVAVVTEDCSAAEVSRAAAAPATDLTPWSMAEWVADHAAAEMHAATEIMSYYGQKTRAQVEVMLPRIRARAASRVRAKASLHGAHTLMGQAEITNRHRAYSKFFVLDDLMIRHQRFDGSMTDDIGRAAFIASDATILLPYDPVRDRVLLVEQIRVGPLARGDRAVWQLEPIAGIIDAGETPAEAARREAQEEAGLTLDTLESVAEVYCSPGNSTEFYYIFLGLADLPDDIIGTGGLDAENEDIRSHLMSFDALMDFVETKAAAKAPLVLAALWLARHRDRLRSGQGADTP